MFLSDRRRQVHVATRGFHALHNAEVLHQAWPYLLSNVGLICLQTAQQWEEQGYVDPESMADLPEDEDTLVKVCAHAAST